MPKKFLVIDANILIRAVLGSRVRQLIKDYSDSVAFYIAEANLNEAEFHLSQSLAQKQNLDEAEWRSVFNGLLDTIQVIPDKSLVDFERQARARIEKRDPNDWPAVAAALIFNCPVWTEDKDFFGAGVATWTTATVELYLSESPDYTEWQRTLWEDKSVDEISRMAMTHRNPDKE
ncbi:PIN domain-containing protein [Methylomagnum sp.]